MRTAPRQPPRSGCLGRASEKCYTGRSTGLVEARLIPIAVGGSAAAFSRRSGKTGENKNVSLGFGKFVIRTFTPPDWGTSFSWFPGPAAGIGSIDPNPVVVDENVPEHQRFDLRHTETVSGNPVDQFLLQRSEEALYPGIVIAVCHTAQALRQSLTFELRAERLAGVL